MLKLNAYRFSATELQKMLWLKELFENNGFCIERFPEVYYDTYDNVTKVFKFKNVANHVFDEIHEFYEPEYLGFYIPEYSKVNCKDDCNHKIVNEGVIVLFEDRIRNTAISISSQLSIGVQTAEHSLRYLVLCHELGHWLTHWPLDSDGLRWDCGYYFDDVTGKADKITHEALAQIITYWCADGRPLEEKIFRKYLTPINPNSEYYKYLALIGISKSEVLNRLKLVRSSMGCDVLLNDESAYELLKAADFVSEIQEWAKIQSIRKLNLSLNRLKALDRKTVDRFILYRFGKKIEYDYILCMLAKEGFLDDKRTHDTLKFDSRFCITK